MERRPVRLWGLGVLAVIHAVSAHASLTDRGHYGQVVDAGSGRPIGEAKVNVVWRAGYPTVHGSGNRCVKMLVLDADNEGRFVLPAWMQEGPPATSFDLEASAHKPGYRLSRSVILAGRMTWLRQLKGSDSLEIEAKPVRIEMQPEHQGPAERVEYLLRLSTTSACHAHRRGVAGAHYHFLRSIYDEALTLPPVKAGAHASHVDLFRQVLSRARKDLIAEDPEQAMLTEDTAPAPAIERRDIRGPAPSAPAQAARPAAPR